MDPNHSNSPDASQGGYPGGSNSTYQAASYPYNSNAPDASQRAYPGASNSPYQAACYPYMYGYQGTPSWITQGYQQARPNFPMMPPSGNGPQGYEPAEIADASKEHDEADVEELNVPPAAPRIGQGRRKNLATKTKLCNFGSDEDVNLVKSWLEISTDPITSTSQKKDRMWDRIMERYNLRRASNPRSPERSVRSLQSRWDIIKAEVGKFSSLYADAVREYRSGMSDADKTTQAATNFAGVYKHSFAFMHCWEIMKDGPKWQDPKGRAYLKSSGGAGFGEDSSIGPDSMDHGEQNCRPMGRDSAKAAKKKANSSAGSAASAEYASRMQDLSLQKVEIMQEEAVCRKDRFQQINNLNEKRFEEMQRHNQMLLNMEQEKVKMEQEKVKIMREKHVREETQDDERILAIDPAACPPALRQYYEVIQAEILEKVAARRGKKQVP